MTITPSRSSFRLAPPPQSSFATSPRPPALSSARARPAWVLLLIATSPERVHLPRGFPLPHYGPSSGFRNPSTVYSALRLAGLFHPAAASRISLVQGVLPSRSHPPSSGGACPLAVIHPELTDRNRLPLRTPSASRLRSARGCVRPAQLFTAPCVAPLLEFYLLQALPFPVVQHGLPVLLRPRCYRLRPSLARSPLAAILDVFLRETRFIRLRITGLQSFRTFQSRDPKSLRTPKLSTD